jgi:hypothetical protein
MAGVGIYGVVVVAALVWNVLWRVAADRAALGGLLVSVLDAGLVIALLLNVARGRRWARTILAALVFGSLCVVILDLSGSPHMVNLRWSLATMPLRIAAVVLFLVPSARGWFRTANPVPAAPEGWHADPLGRHEQRFWDGTLWTLQAADGQRVRWDVGSLGRLWGGYWRDWFAFRDPAAAPAGWYGDPHGRHEARFWSGDRWTSLVSDAGQMSTDETRVRGFAAWLER